MPVGALQLDVRGVKYFDATDKDIDQLMAIPLPTLLIGEAQAYQQGTLRYISPRLLGKLQVLIDEPLYQIIPLRVLVDKEGGQIGIGGYEAQQKLLAHHLMQISFSRIVDQTMQN